jgi:hypothetical protein
MRRWVADGERRSWSGRGLNLCATPRSMPSSAWTLETTIPGAGSAQARGGTWRAWGGGARAPRRRLPISGGGIHWHDPRRPSPPGAAASRPGGAGGGWLSRLPRGCGAAPSASILLRVDSPPAGCRGGGGGAPPLPEVLPEPPDGHRAALGLYDDWSKSRGVFVNPAGTVSQLLLQDVGEDHLKLTTGDAAGTSGAPSCARSDCCSTSRAGSSSTRPAAGGAGGAGAGAAGSGGGGDSGGGGGGRG